MKNLLITTTILAVLAAFQPALANEGHEQAPADKSTSSAPVVSDPMADIQAHFTTLDEMFAAGTLPEMHAVIEKIEKADKTLEEKTTLTGENKTRLSNAVKQLNAQLTKLHKVSDKSDKAATETELKKAKSALKLVENALK